MRGKSDAPHPGGGWLHFMDAERSGVEIVSAPRPKKIDAEPLAREMYRRFEASRARSSLSKRLGVSAESLDCLRVGYGEDRDGRQYASFPSRDATGRIVGITRRYLDGSKKSYPGTTNGVFCAKDWWQTPGVVLVVEGGSDVAACITHGLCAIGRPSNIGGADIIRDMLNAHARNRPVIVVGENDFKPDKRGLVDWCPEDCKGCAHCYPGLFGAEFVASRLGCEYSMPPYPFKDFRDMCSSVIWLEALRAIGTRKFF
jgi:hypothetical protein